MKVHSIRWMVVAGAVSSLAFAQQQPPQSQQPQAAKPQAGKVAAAPAGATATAMFKDASGKELGEARLTETPKGVLVKAHLTGVPAGEHAFHVHEVGKCEPPFQTAGGHWNPLKKAHGMAAKKGMHAGDMPNVWVAQNGEAHIEQFLPGATLKKGAVRLLDKDGAALMLHASADDHSSDPAGNAGDRIACAVVQESAEATAPGTEAKGGKGGAAVEGTHSATPPKGQPAKPEPKTP